MLHHIHRSTMRYGRTVDPGFDISLANLETIIGCSILVVCMVLMLAFSGVKFGCKLFLIT